MSLPLRSIRPSALAFGLVVTSSSSFAQEALDLARYVEIVKRSHPAAAERAGLERAAEAEGSAARALPDPVLRLLVGPRAPHGGAGGQGR